MNEEKRIENLEINPYIYVQFIFSEGVKTIQWEKNSLSMKKKKKKGFEPLPYHIQKIPQNRSKT